MENILDDEIEYKSINKIKALYFEINYDHYFGKICNDCGEIYDNYSYCCIKKGIIGTLKEILFDGYYCSGSGITKIKLIPFIFIYFFSWSIVFGIFFNRKKTINNNMFANYIFNANCGRTLTIIIADLIVFLHSLIFMFIFLIIS